MGILVAGGSKLDWDPVHPHTHGDFFQHAGRRLLLRGSPPHAWGFWGRGGGARRVRRFTPTRMGILDQPAFVGAEAPVHPHTHGDFVYLKNKGSSKSGSPPHAWGFSCQVYQIDCLISVHPHTHGDFYRRGRRQYPNTGSPPHAWGFCLCS